MIYLACPSVPGCFKIVNVLAADYIKNKTPVFSPLSHSIPIARDGKLPTDWEFWKDFDLEMLSKCSRIDIVNIHGIEESKGVAAETKYAEVQGIPFQYHSGSWIGITSLGSRTPATRVRLDGYENYICRIKGIDIEINSNDLLRHRDVWLT